MKERAQLLVSTALMLDDEAVLTQPERLERSRLTATDVRWRPIATDPNDDLVLETAINGGANAVASFNVKDLAAGAAQFGILVERPATIIRRILR